MKNYEQEKEIYPTEVAKILNIKKLEYDKKANNDEDMLLLRKEYEVVDVMQNISKEKQIKQQKHMQFLRQTR